MAELIENNDEATTNTPTDFDISMLRGVPIGYVPLQTNVQGEPDGSLWSAQFRNNTTIGAFINSPNSNDINQENIKSLSIEETIDLVPRDLLLNYLDRYIGKDPTQFDAISDQIRQELADKELMAAHPWKSLGVSLMVQPFDPVNWLPLGALYKNATRGKSLVKSIVGSGSATALAAAGQEAILQQNQLAREAQESVMNIVTSGILGGAIGGIGAGLTIRGRAKSAAQIKARRNAAKEFNQILTDQDKQLDANGLLTGQDLASLPSGVRKMMNITPMNRLLNSPFSSAKFFASAMYEHNYTLLKHLDEESGGASVETLIRLDKGKVASAMIDYQNIFYSMHGISKGPFKGTRAKLSDTGMTAADFDTEVIKSIITDTPHPNNHVDQAAKLLRDRVFKPARDQAISLGLLPEDVTPRNAVGYVMSVYNKNKIIEQGGKFTRAPGTFPVFLHEKFKEIQNQIKVFKESPVYKFNTKQLLKRREDLKTAQAKKQLLPKDKKESIKKINETIKSLKEQIKNFEETIKKAAPKQALNSDGELFPVLDDKALWASVEQTIDNILGDSEGQMLNPLLEKLAGGSTKPLKNRKMPIAQDEMLEWMVTDVSKIVDMYSRAMHPMIRLTEFAQKMGVKDITEMEEAFSKMIMNEFDEQVKGKTGKDATALRQKRDDNISDMINTIKLLKGVYGAGPNVLNDSAQKYYQNFLKWNYVRLLGYMTISSLADAGLQVFVHGPYRFIHDGLVKTFSEARNISKQDLRAIGYGIETELGTRLKSYVEHQGLSTNPGPFTKGLDALTQKFGNLSLMNQWNSWHQNMAGHIGINRTLQTIHKAVKGEKVSKIESERLVKLGIDKKHWETIYQFTKDNDSNGTLFADWTNWDIRNAEQAEALTQFQAAVAKEIDNIVIVPGLGDKPLYAQTPIGKLLFQFKSFLMASTNRVMVSGIQRKNDINTYLGVLSMLGMGGLSYVATSLLRGDEPDLSFKKLSVEAVDRSGLLGIWGETLNIGGKIFGFETSRYASRNVVGAMLGPTYGAAGELVYLMNSVSNSIQGKSDITTKDAEKYLRFMPMQNLFYLHQLVKKGNHNLAVELGAIDTD